jgi:AcrR family transcriptional regulator
MDEHRQKKSRHDLLLDAVVEELLTSGINDLSLRGLASHLDTSHRVLLYHFGSKEQLISEVVQEVRRREKSHFEESVTPNSQGSIVDVLTAFYAHNVSDSMSSYFRLFYEVWGIALSNPSSYENFLDGIVSVWVDSLSDVLIHAGLSKDEARTNATLVLAALRGLQLDIFTTGQRDRADQAFARLVSLIEAGIAQSNAHQSK